MIDITETILLLIKVAIAFFLLYIIIPYKLIKIDKEKSGVDTLEKIFICFIHANFITIILVHVLALFKIYETVSLIIGYILVAAAYYWIINQKKDKKTRDQKISAVAKVLDSIDVNGGIPNTIKSVFVTIGENIYSPAQGIYTKFRSSPISMILVIAVFAFGAFIRFSHSILHVYYGTPDSYVHLAWTKYLGDNHFYTDGIYPYGYNAIISALSKISFIDPYVIIRFIGAIGSCLIIFSVYFFIRKMSKNAIIPAIFGIAAYAVGTELPINASRQMNALPQEYATVFILPGIYFLLKYFENKERKFLFLAAEVLTLTLLIHTYAAVILTAGYLLVCLLNIRSFFSLKFIAKFTGIMLASALFGFLPIIIGLFSGLKMHKSSIDFIIQGGGTTGMQFQLSNLFAYTEKNTALVVMLIISVVFIVVSLIGIYNNNNKANTVKIKAGLVMVLMSLILYLQYRAQYIGLPALMETSRTGTFLGLAAAVVFGLFIGSIDIFPINKWLANTVKVIACAVVFTFLFHVSNFSLPVGGRQEYDEAGYSYMRIKENYPVADWTIVSPVEQYSESLGYGLHYQLWQFVKDVEVDKKSNVTIPTQYVFWFIEKIPVNSTQKITEADAKISFPDITGNYDEYYTIDANRKIVEAKAYYWIEDYMNKHKNLNMSIYLDTENFRIYMLKQDAANPVDFMK